MPLSIQSLEKEDRLYKFIIYDQASYEKHIQIWLQTCHQQDLNLGITPAKIFSNLQVGFEVQISTLICQHPHSYTLKSPVISVSCLVCLLWLVVVIYVMTTIIGSVTFLVAYPCIGIPYHTINILFPPMITSHCYICKIYKKSQRVSNEVRI